MTTVSKDTHTDTQLLHQNPYKVAAIEFLRAASYVKDSIIARRNSHLACIQHIAVYHPFPYFAVPVISTELQLPLVSARSEYMLI